jgi:lipoprotein
MKKLLFSALMGAMIISCSRDNDNTNPITPQTPATNETGIIPTKLTYSQTGKTDEVITFSYNGNKLMKVTHDNKDVIYTYTGDLITSINNPDGSSHVFNYDSNGNLISEKEESYSGTIKVLEENTTYTINGSTVKAQKISKNYDDITGTLSSISTSTITYTLDAKKRPIKSVEVSEERDSTGNLIEKTNNNTTTYQYANHHSLIENIVGFDKLTYSDFLSNNEDFPHDIVSYMKEDINRTYYHFGGSPHNESYINEVKVEYSVNANNYPIKIQHKAKNHINGQFENRDNSYYTIEYNK